MLETNEFSKGDMPHNTKTTAQKRTIGEVVRDRFMGEQGQTPVKPDRI